MAKNEDLFFTKEGKLITATLGTAASPNTLLTVPTDGIKLISIVTVTGTPDTGFFINDVDIFTIEDILGIVAAPTLFGSNGLPIWSPKDANGNHYLNIAGGDVIKAGSDSADGDKVIMYYEEY